MRRYLFKVQQLTGLFRRSNTFKQWLYSTDASKILFEWFAVNLGIMLILRFNAAGGLFMLCFTAHRFSCFGFICLLICLKVWRLPSTWSAWQDEQLFFVSILGLNLYELFVRTRKVGKRLSPIGQNIYCVFEVYAYPMWLSMRTLFLGAI